MTRNPATLFVRGRFRPEWLRAARPSDGLVPVTLLFITFAALAITMPPQADTFYHLRSGQAMVESRRILDTELFSHTAYGRPLLNHWWLSQLIFFGAHTLGGPLLLTLVTAASAFLALLLSWRMTKGGTELRFVLLFALALVLPEWTVRPQAFSMLLLVLTIRLLMADRLVWVPPLLVLWANMHGVVVLGVLASCTVLADAILWERQRLGKALVLAGASVAAPLISPLGVHYWTRVIATVRDSPLLGIDEVQSLFTWRLDRAIPVWLLMGVFAFMALRALPQQRTRARGDRLLVLIAALLMLTAITSIRNVAFFALAGVPALSRLWPVGRVRREPPAATLALALVALGFVVASGVAVYRWRDGGAHLGWKPFSPAAIDAIRRCPDPLYNTFYDGGALMWFVPERRVFVDGRVEAYPLDFLLRVQRAEVAGDYRSLFQSYGIACAIIGNDSYLVRRFRSDPSLIRQFSDDKWTVFVKRPAA